MILCFVYFSLGEKVTFYANLFMKFPYSRLLHKIGYMDWYLLDCLK
jgi:hypothetical protein